MAVLSVMSLSRASVALLLTALTSVSASADAQATLSGGSQDPLPAVYPPPQQISALGCAVRLNKDVNIVTGNSTDAATLDVIKAVVAASGGKATVSSAASEHGTQIFVGESDDAAAAAKALSGDSAQGLAKEGYVLASGKYNGHPSIALNGADVRGTFYAAQTLRQLADGKKGVPGVKVKDWPLMPVRGSIEGFYGFPWSHQARKDQYVLYGKHKMNTYVYTPKSDALLRAKWRELYTGDDLKQLGDLIKTANYNHVDFTWALSPGLDLCYSGDADWNATVAKLDQVRGLGVTSFYVALDDIPLEFHCDEDKAKWKDNGDYHWLADAQAFYLNRVQKEYVEKYGLLDLETVPTNYAGSAPDPYKGEFGTQLDKKIRVQWTGEGVFSPNVTSPSVIQADKTYVTDNLFIWDNFPVNDGMPHRLFLNPLIGRDADLYKHMLGFTSNPMVQSYASMLALINYADYTWNGPAYDSSVSMAAAIQELAGNDRKVLEALMAFVDINQSWPYRTPTEYAPALSRDIAAFWAARKAGDAKGRKPLMDRLALFAELPDRLVPMAMKPFAPEVKPWSTVALQWANACQHMIKAVDAKDKGDQATADAEYKAAQGWVDKTKEKTVASLNDAGVTVPNSITPTTGDNVFDKFVADATAIYKGN